MATFPFRLRCASVAYRKGLIEVCPGIHDSLVNLETWGVSSEWEQPLTELAEIPDDALAGNTEIELSAAEARSLAQALLAAADLVSGARTHRVHLLVLRCADPQRSADFYGALGLHFVRERHEVGPTHFSAELGGFVLELYPTHADSSRGDTSGVRLGLRLATSCDSVLQALSIGGTLVSPEQLCASDRDIVVRDPDGHTLALTLLS